MADIGDGLTGFTLDEGLSILMIHILGILLFDELSLLI